MKESRDGPEPALRFYQQVLEADPSNSVCYFPSMLRFQFTEKELQQTIWAREISVLRKLGKIDLAVDQLSKFADTFYTDVEAWLELADIYASQHQYVSHPPTIE